MNERKTYTTTLNIDLMTEIRELSQRKTKHQNDLIEEAIQDVLKKYKDLHRPEPSSADLSVFNSDSNEGVPNI